jgi:lysozyme family protein
MTKYAYQKDNNYCTSVKLVFSSEGGYVNDPEDKGGATKFGIAYNYNATYLKDNFGITGPEGMFNLTIEQARQLYYDKYWIKCEADIISNLPLAYMHFDAAVNQGVGKSLEFLNSLSKSARHFDGSNGKNKSLFDDLLVEYTIKRIRHYIKCRDRKRYLEGWMKRLADVLDNCLNLT